MSGIFGKSTHTYSDRLVGLSFSSSTYGQPLPLAYGTPRINGNLIDYDDFSTHANTTSASGKGGGSTSTNYTYSASMVFALCEGGAGGIAQVGRVWRDKEIETLAYYGFTLKNGAWGQSAYSYWSSNHAAKALPYSGTAYAAIANFALGDTNSTGTWGFETMALLATETDTNQQISLGTGNGTNPTFELLDANGMSITDLSGYPSRLFYVQGVATTAYTLGTVNGNYYVTFTTAPTNGASVTWAGTSVLAKDARPESVVSDFLTNAYYGAGWASARIADLSAGASSYGVYCQAMGFAISPVFKESKAAKDHLQDILDATNAEALMSPDNTGRMVLKVVPLGDQSISANGTTYTPTIAVRAALTYDDFLGVLDASGVPTGDDAITIERVSPADVKNIVPVNFSDRMDAYNTGNAQEPEQTDVAQNGEKKDSAKDMPMIVRRAHAKTISKILAQRNCWVRNTYTFKVGWKWILLEPLDFVTLTDPILGLNAQLVRIDSVEMPEESGEEDGLTIVASDWPYGTGHATVYGATEGGGSGTTVNGQADPGNTTAVVFDSPASYSASGGPELLVAATGGSKWGGCNVWASLDGATYSQVGTIGDKGRFGTLTAALAVGGNASVDLSASTGTLTSVTAAVAASGQTLCWCDGELMGYSTATLTSGYAYTLALPLRGAIDTVAASHASGKSFVRLDGGIFRYAVPSSQLGTAIYIKLQSFNTLGGGVQDLSTLSPVTYTPTSQGTYANSSGSTSSSSAARSASSDWLTRDKKPTLVNSYNTESASYMALSAQAQGLAIGYTAYQNAWTAVMGFLTALTPAWSDTTQDTYLGSGGGDTLTSLWSTLTAAEAALVTTITQTIASNAASAAAIAAQNAAISAAATTAMQKADYTTDGVHINGTTLAGASITAAAMANSNSTNLIPNPNSEATAPTGGWPSGALEAVGLSSSSAYAGTKSRMVQTTTGTQTWLAITAYIACNPGEQFFVQAYTAPNTATTTATIDVVAYSATKAWVGDVCNASKSTTGWGAISASGTVPSGVSFVLVLIGVSGAAGDLAFFDNLYLGKVIVAGMLAANSVVAGNVAAKAISVESLTVANFDNLVPNPNCSITNPTAGSLESVGLSYDGGSWTGTNGYCRRLTWAAGVDTGYAFYVAEVSVNPGDEYYFEFKGLRNVNPSDGMVYGGLVFLSDTASDIAPPSGAGTGAISGISTYSGWAVAPTGATKMRLILRHYGGTLAGDALFNFFYLRRRANASVIVDGSITAAKLAATLITTSDIRSTNFSSGASGTAPSGFRISGYTFTTTYKDGSTGTSNMEIGGDVNIGGYKALTVVDLAVNRSMVISTAGTYDFVIPAGVFLLDIQMQGSGNGGYGYDASTSSYGSIGGYAGGYVRHQLPVTPGNTVRFVLGSPGEGGPTGSGSTAVSVGTRATETNFQYPVGTKIFKVGDTPVGDYQNDMISFIPGGVSIGTRSSSTVGSNAVASTPVSTSGGVVLLGGWGGPRGYKGAASADGCWQGGDAPNTSSTCGGGGGSSAMGRGGTQGNAASAATAGFGPGAGGGGASTTYKTGGAGVIGRFIIKW